MDGHRLIVVKIGSAVIAPGGRLDPGAVDRLSGEIAEVVRAGRRVALVSSGAVACGLGVMGLSAMPAKIRDKQACAAAGQPILMRAWGEAFERRGLSTAQVLLTSDDIDFRARFVNAHRTMGALLDAGVVPIVNENDSVSFEEIRLGDNDRLSALVAGLIGADLLVMLSSVDGLRAKTAGGLGELIRRVDDVSAARAHVADERSATGVGGMATKLDAAEVAVSMGVSAVIASGAEAGVLGRVVEGDAVGTRFDADPARVAGHAGRKKWIAHSLRTKGAVVVDDGARRALVERGASLLPKGVVSVQADEAAGFGIGAAVTIRDRDGVDIARGLVSYRSDEIARIAGLGSAEIEGRLGYSYCDEVIHRDDLILLEGVK